MQGDVSSCKIDEFTRERTSTESKVAGTGLGMPIVKKLVEHAEDGIVCVDMLQKAAPDYYDLILMDIQMPNMDGYKATQIIRRLPDKQKAAIPIIAMTANAFEEDRKNAFRIGMNGHIAKPIVIDEVIKTIARNLDR